MVRDIIVIKGEYTGMRIAAARLTVSIDGRYAQVWIGRDHVEFALGFSALWVFDK